MGFIDYFTPQLTTLSLPVKHFWGIFKENSHLGVENSH